ncbi:MAG: cellobiose phosphorylase [Anaerolineae bacterium]|nr:cellobiose phosphorylase [Anaerolineae bacterium]
MLNKIAVGRQGQSAPSVAARDQLEELAVDLARIFSEAVPRQGKFFIPQRLRALGRYMQAARRHFEGAIETKTVVPQAAEWLLDNYYVIEQALRQVEEDLPAQYYRRLPKIGGQARIWVLALALARYSRNRLEAGQLVSFIQAHQESCPLTTGELWAFPVMLRLASLELIADGLELIVPVERDFPSPPCDLPTDNAQDFGLSYSTLALPAEESFVAAGILSLRLLATQNWKTFFDTTSPVEKILRQDPAQVYEGMDSVTHSSYHSAIEELAQNCPFSEIQIAHTLIELARETDRGKTNHVGYFLIDEGRRQLEARLSFRAPLALRARRWLYRYAEAVYLGSIAALTAGLISVAFAYALVAGIGFGAVLIAAILAALPVSSLAVGLVNWLVVRILPPRVLPKLDFKTGVPAEYRTMIVIPALLRNESEVTALLGQLELHYLGNEDPNFGFALLTDFTDASQKTLPGDERLVEAALAGVNRLNTRYGQKMRRPFYLFHRERKWNPRENCWMGWERKRGKLTEFNALLRGEKTGFVVQEGDLDFLRGARFVITLDTDTILPRESARRLVGTLAHPLNRAEFDAGGQVTRGYVVLQPRVQVRPVMANQSLFTRVYSGDTVLDLYTRAVSDVYHDLFGEGSYVGKGIYDAASFERCLRGHVPDNAILSHDLFEGIHGRCGLVTDVVLFEDYPTHYLAQSHRTHRWVRGDWQLLPWLGRYVPDQSGNKIKSDFSMIDRWKMLDNMRRSLVPGAVLVMLVFGWLFIPGNTILWEILAFGMYLLAVLSGVFDSMRRHKGDFPETSAQPFRQAALRVLLEMVFLPHRAFINADAIGSTLVRLLFTRKRLLQWVTAAHTISAFGRELKFRVAWDEMVWAVFLGGGLLLGISVVRPSHLLPLALPLVIAWMASPVVATLISRPRKRAVQKLTATEEQRLRLLARSTWLYFEHFVTPEDHWLPPDHFQEEPRGAVAHSTSPTNIGLMLLSTLAAYDLGYINTQELALRLSNAFDSLDALEKVRGHLLNWYDTRTLTPLPPRYVSTVDSGNFAASLVALRQGCHEVAGQPVVNWKGLLDTIDVLMDAIEQAQFGESAARLRAAISTVRGHAEGLLNVRVCSPEMLKHLLDDERAGIEKLLVELVEFSSEQIDPLTLQTLYTWADRLRSHLQGIRRTLQVLHPWALTLGAAPPSIAARLVVDPEFVAAWDGLQRTFVFCPPLQDIPDVCARALEKLDVLMKFFTSDHEVLAWAEKFSQELQAASATAEEMLAEFTNLIGRINSYLNAMHFGFLYESGRQVFHIGYNVETGQLDPNYYDLLASECRIASLYAIAAGDVPQSHWLHLARPLTRVDSTRALLSWSGTMFEYLMPMLLVESYPETLLHQSCYAAVEHQRDYARQKKLPCWGISESSYYHFDANQTYQYRAFGAPKLGYKRGLSEDLVVTPYASVLALPIAPRAVLENLDNFASLQMFGLYGLYESVDFTPERLGAGVEYARVRTYMAHHQGMILLTLANRFGKSMVLRLHSDPRIKGVELLLQERVPTRAPTERPHPQEVRDMNISLGSISVEPWEVSPAAPYPQVHTLTNGHYNLLITAAGTGFSSWGHVDLTRWRADPTFDALGTWIYVQDRQDGSLWSVAHQPIGKPAQTGKVNFHPHKVVFERREGDISMNTTIAIAADDDVEIRQVNITNHGDAARQLALTSYAEMVLAPQSTDRRHPAFNKLFIESEYIPKENLLLFRRRPRSANEKAVYVVHFVAGSQENIVLSGIQTDRARFLGRGGSARKPAFKLIRPPGPARDATKEQTVPLDGIRLATLDPICAMQVQLDLLPYETVHLAFITLAAVTRKEAIDLARRYRRWSRISRAIEEAFSESARELAYLSLDSMKIVRIQKLLSALLYPCLPLRADAATLGSNTLSQPGLWSFSISGDYPILLVRLKTDSDIELLAELLQAHTYWRRRGLMIDLVILNRRETSYDNDYSGQIGRLLERTASQSLVNQRGGIFVLREDQMSEAERALLASVARVVLDGENGLLERQLDKLDAQPVRLPRFVSVQPALPVPEPDSVRFDRPPDLLFDNGLGGFTPDGREYIINLRPGDWTPAPWCNVIATPEFGFLVSESGFGCTWAHNSGENRLTPWTNDPVSDTPAEVLYLRDEDTGQVWTPTPLPARAETTYRITHGAGYSIFANASHGLEQSLRVFAVPTKPVKVIQLRIKNTTSRMRRITTTYYAEWVLGTTREESAPHIIPEFASSQFALLARNPYNTDYGQRVAFLAATREIHGVTTDRAEFLGRHGSYACPAALERVGITPNISPGADPCAAVQSLLWLEPGAEKEVTFLLGQGADRAEAEQLIRHYQDFSNVQLAWDSLAAFWDDILGQIQIRTPEPAFDILLNRWLLYQSLACRIWGRTAFYQSSGAFGFRDQLQDAMALVYSLPADARKHILRAAAHQFEQGDVLHWWHPPLGRGIRTRCSDNLLWLPFVTAHYVQATGDTAILNEQIPYLSGEPLEKGEHERYGQFFSTQSGTLYEHCLRALEKGITRGAHNLPLIGAHDWNDGLSRVGKGGQGESVWLGWFIHAALTNFAEICDSYGDKEKMDILRAQAEEFRLALEANAWDGEWYLRAFFDDGEPLGSAANSECQIDSIAQSWAVISGAADSARARTAMQSVYRQLVRHEDGLVQLFNPPFERIARDPGYIKGYPPGIRENGGQYTHAALWTIWAFAQLGENERAAELFRLINPIYHTDLPEKIQRYRVEPYVVAADVYSVAPFNGRGGWTWYTGSASWMYRLGIEQILGIRKRGDELHISPCIPIEWSGFEVDYVFGAEKYHIVVKGIQEGRAKRYEMFVNGKKAENGVVKLGASGMDS